MLHTGQASHLEQSIRARQVADLLPISDGFVLPDYAGRSLANVPATVARALGAHLDRCAPPLEEGYWRSHSSGVRRVVLVLLDALGYLQLCEMLTEEPGSIWARLAAQGSLLPMTSIYPSTTATALATLMTGVEPIAHGLLGYELWLREYGVLAQMLSVQPAYGTGKETLLDWGLVPEAFLPVPGLGTRLAEHGIDTYGYVPAQFAQSALTRMLYRGFGHLVGYADVDDLCDVALHRLEEGGPGPSFHWLYWGGIDNAIHRYGTSEASEGHWKAQYRAATHAFEERFINRLSSQSREGTLFVLCADHGFVDTPVACAHDTDADPVLRTHLLVPYSGESRAAYLHCRAGAFPQAHAEIQGSLGEQFCVRRTDDLIEAGLFGLAEPAPESLARLGDLHVVSRSQHYLDRADRRHVLRGRHGGLTPEEMLVPWLVSRLDV